MNVNVNVSGASVSIGVDLVEIPRLQGAIRRYGDRLLDRLFTPAERRAARRRRRPVEYLAGRFAAKEAYFKASGRRCPWKALEVRNAPDGAPYFAGHPNVEGASAVSLSLSLSHTAHYAVAVVLVPMGPDSRQGDAAR